MASMREMLLRFTAQTAPLKASAGQVKKTLNGVANEGGKSGKSLASRFGSGLMSIGKSVISRFGKLITGGLKAGVAGLAAVAGAAIVKGFKRLTAIEDATAKLKGLGNSGKATAAIMKDALAAVKGTAFGMDEAATTAATAVAAGVKPGKELQKYLRLVADAATIAGVDMGEMASIINKTTTSGRVQTDELNQLADRGIPIWTALAKHYGVNATELRKMVSAGKVDAKTFQAVLQKQVGGAAEAAGNTTTGAFKNMGAALSRLGAGLLTGVFPYFRKTFKGITDLLDDLTPAAEKFGAKIGKAFGRVQAALVPARKAVEVFVAGFRGVLLGEDTGLGEWATRFWTAGQTVAGILDQLRESAGRFNLKAVVEAFSPITTAVKGALPALASAGDSFRAIGASIGGALAKVLPTVGKSLVSLIGTLTTAATGALPGVVAGIGSLAKVAAALAPAAGAVASGLAAVVGAVVKLLSPLLSNQKAMQVLTVGILAGVAAYKTYKIITGAIRAVQIGLTAATYGTAGATYATGGALKVYNAIARITAIRTKAMGIAQRVVAAAGFVKTIAMQTAALVKNAAVFAAQKTAMLAASVAQKAVAAGQWLINAAMSANPIGLVIAGLTLLVGGLILAYKRSATFRKIVNAAFTGVKTVAGAVLSWLSKAVSSTIGFVRKHWSTIKAILLGPLGIAVTLIKRHWGTIRKAFSSAVSWTRGAFRKSWAVVRTVLIAPITAALTGIRNAWTKIRGAFSSAKTWVGGSWRKSWSNVKAWMSNSVANARTAINTSWGKTKDTFRNAKNWVGGTWRKSWSNVKSWMSDSVRKGREYVGTAWTSARGKFSSAKTWVGGAWRKSWSNVKDWMANPIRNGRTLISKVLGSTGLQSVFRKAVSAMGRIWGRLKNVVMNPVKSLINLINSKLIKGGINWLLNKLGVPKGEQIPWIPVPTFRTGGPAFGRAGQRGGRDKILAMLDHGEHVWTREEMRKFPGGHRSMLRWREAVRRGKVFDAPRDFRPQDMPGFKGGGVVRPVPGGFGAFPSYPGHTGVDFPVGRGTPIHAAMAGLVKTVRSLNYSYGRHVIQSLPGGMEAVYAHMRNYIVRGGQRVGAGQVLGYVNSTGNSTGDHLHFTLQHPGGNYVNPTSFLNSGKLPSGGFGSAVSGALSDVFGFLKGLDPLAWLKNKVKGIGASIAKFMDDNPWARGLSKVPGLAIAKGGKYLKEKFFDNVFSSGEDPGGTGVERWRSTIVQALKMNGLPTSDAYVSAWLRQVRSESNGNPKAVQNGYVDVNTISGDLAKGLLQTISATFNAYKFPGYGDIFNGLHNALAAIHYAKSRYGAKSMLGVIGHGHGYDRGGWLPPGTSVVTNRTGQPEPILNPQQWAAVMNLSRNTNQPAGPQVVITVDGALDPTAVAKQIRDLLTRDSRIRGGVTLGARTR